MASGKASVKTAGTVCDTESTKKDLINRESHLDACEKDLAGVGLRFDFKE